MHAVERGRHPERRSARRPELKGFVGAARQVLVTVDNFFPEGVDIDTGITYIRTYVYMYGFRVRWTDVARDFPRRTVS